MSNLQPEPTELMRDRFGRRVAARLSAGTAELPYEITERLRAGRVQALAMRKTIGVQTAPAVFRAGAAATLAFGGEGPSWWRRVAAAIPLVVLAAGLVVITVVQNDRRATEVAEVDAALLTDDLPPQAYADPGFIQFLKAGGD